MRYNTIQYIHSHAIQYTKPYTLNPNEHTCTYAHVHTHITHTYTQTIHKIYTTYAIQYNTIHTFTCNTIH